jgi:hypothetical protein
MSLRTSGPPAADVGAESRRQVVGAGLARGERPTRCLVPVDNFYEWKKTPTGKQPYAIALGPKEKPAPLLR